MTALRIASCMAENTETFCLSLAGYLERKLGIPAEYVTGIPWQERERLFDEGEIQLVWLCGLPYIDKAERRPSEMELLAVPVPMGRRYRRNPVYFSDVVVRRDSPFTVFDDLRGSAWAYNEPRSHSGYNVIRAYLAAQGETKGFFRRAVESGAHTASIAMLLSRQVDAAAVDTTVLEWILSGRPEIESQIRVIESIGPSPMPPWVISKRVPEELREQLRTLLLHMDQDSEGRAVLGRGRILRFATARDRDYDSIRRMARMADMVAHLELAV